MTSSESTQSTPRTTKRSYYKKRLEGINANAVLLDLWKDVYSKNVTSTDGSTDSETKAIQVLRSAGDPSKLEDSQSKHKTVVMPINVLQSIRLLLPSSTRESLDQALDDRKDTSLAFTPPFKPELTLERKRYLERIEKLKLKTEETRYSKITNNIKDQRQEDDKTTKSMTYAASIGINMIVAPISFGTFMYFFSGGVFDFFFPPDPDYVDRNPTGVDIKRVIVAVVSGVIMMIIEMVLFVIRSHEFETHTTKKKKKRGVQPFGSYSANSAKEYTDSSGGGGGSTRSKTTKDKAVAAAAPSGEALQAKKTK